MEEKLITDQLPVPGSEDEFIENESPVIPISEDEVTDLQESSVSDEVQPIESDQPVVDPNEGKTELEKLIARRTGFWQVKLDAADAKWVKNACQGKFEYTGPNEAFMLMNCFLGFSAAVARQEQEKQTETIVVQASAIEACGFFVNRFSGSGLDSAQRLFRIAMSLNNVMLELRSLDDQIKVLREIEAATKTEPEPESIESENALTETK